MSLRLEMLQVARLASKSLGDASELVHGFLLSRRREDGGFVDRSGRSDLYYTVFGLEGLLALRADGELASSEGFLRSHGAGEGLDFIHLCCLARGWAVLRHVAPHLDLPSGLADTVRQALVKHRTPDGGFHAIPGNASGSAYGAFLALGAVQDARIELNQPLEVVRSLKLLETSDGGWTNEIIPNAPALASVGSTNATAAAVAVLHGLGMPIGDTVKEFLLGMVHAEGGFLAMPRAPMPDLLSTATALHALSTLQVGLSPIRERCLDFLDSLWTNEGSFHGHWADEFLDTEYTFYALLALGHLSD